MKKLLINTGCDLRTGIAALILVTDNDTCDGLKELKSFALEWNFTAPVYTGDGRWVCLPIMNMEAERSRDAVADLAVRLFGDKKRRVPTVEAVPRGGAILEVE